jgi:hypothetical protein
MNRPGADRRDPRTALGRPVRQPAPAPPRQTPSSARSRTRRPDVLDRVDDPGAGARFDLVLCKQARGERVLVSTRRVQVYHPSRTTSGAGRTRVSSACSPGSGDRASLTVRPARASAACLAMPIGLNVDIAARRTGLAPPGRLADYSLNRDGAVLDRRSSGLGEPGAATTSANHDATAEAHT